MTSVGSDNERVPRPDACVSADNCDGNDRTVEGRPRADNWDGGASVKANPPSPELVAAAPTALSVDKAAVGEADPLGKELGSPPEGSAVGKLSGADRAENMERKPS